MKHTWKQKAKCDSCSGTGVYRGLGEKGKASVVCHTCRGTGCKEIQIEWEDFAGKIKMNDIKRVVEINTGIVIDEDPKFGGMPYEDWFGGKPFPPKSENRNYVCPMWWYQSADYRRKPNWKECMRGWSFLKCPKFKKKHLCWERWDKESGGLEAKMKMKKENAEALYARFDFLDPKERFMESSFGCPDNWFQLLWNLCEGIENELEKNPRLRENFRVLQTKEKWGMLRFYVDGGNDKIKNMIEEAMEESKKIRR